MKHDQAGRTSLFFYLSRVHHHAAAAAAAQYDAVDSSVRPRGSIITFKGFHPSIGVVK
jgi:hypothetical protein